MYIAFDETNIQCAASLFCNTTNKIQSWHVAPTNFVPDQDMCMIANNGEISILSNEQKEELLLTRAYLDAEGFNKCKNAIAHTKDIHIFLDKQQLINNVKQKRNAFFANGFAWINASGVVNSYEISEVSQNRFFRCYIDRQYNVDIKESPERVKFGVHERPNYEFELMVHNEFMMFYDCYTSYVRTIEVAISALCDDIKRATLMSDIAILPDLDFIKMIEDIPVTYDTRTIFQKVVFAVPNMVTASRLKKHNDRYKAVMQLSSDQLEGLDMSIMTNDQKAITQSRIGF